MIRDFRASIMAPIGEPINITGLNPIFKRPEPFVRDLPIQVPPREFIEESLNIGGITPITCLLYTSPSPRDVEESRMPSSA